MWDNFGLTYMPGMLSWGASLLETRYRVDTLRTGDPLLNAGHAQDSHTISPTRQCYRLVIFHTHALKIESLGEERNDRSKESNHYSNLQ